MLQVFKLVKQIRLVTHMHKAGAASSLSWLHLGLGPRQTGQRADLNQPRGVIYGDTLVTAGDLGIIGSLKVLSLPDAALQAGLFIA